MTVHLRGKLVASVGLVAISDVPHRNGDGCWKIRWRFKMSITPDNMVVTDANV